MNYISYPKEIFERLVKNPKYYVDCSNSSVIKGHYRHYKSGKMVFVKLYQKGEGKIHDKEYVITL